jgi:hypothetical protein
VQADRYPSDYRQWYAWLRFSRSQSRLSVGQTEYER